MKLYFKMHPACIAYLIDNKTYGTMHLTSDLCRNGDAVAKWLDDIAVKSQGFVEEIIIEKPWLRLQGDNAKRLADDIIHIQRNFGVVLYLLHKSFPKLLVTHVSPKVARLAVYGRETISKDVQFSETRVLLEGIRDTDPDLLTLLCLHDVLVLKRYRCLEQTSGE